MKKLGLAFVLLVLTVCLATPVMAKKGDHKGKGSAGEKITAVDTASVTTSAGTYTTGDDTKVTIDGQDAKIADLKVGMKVKVTPSSDGKSAASIEASTASTKKK